MGVLVTREEGFWLPVPFKSQEMMENEISFCVFLTNINYWQVSYGASFVRILEMIDHIIMTLYIHKIIFPIYWNMRDRVGENFLNKLIT